MRHTDGMVDEAKRSLRELLKPGSTVYVIQRHKTGSGASRILSLIVARNERIIDVTILVAMLLRKATMERNGKEGIRLQTPNANPAQQLVSEISQKLFEGEGPTGKKADPESHDLTQRPVGYWLLSELL